MGIFTNVGGTVLLLYWTVHTLRIALTPRINTRMKAIKFDLNTGDEETKTQAKRNFRLIKVAVGGLLVSKWVENALLVIIAAWVLFTIGLFVFAIGHVWSAPLSPSISI